MKVVITGGAGFLGKKLARRLLQGGIAGPSAARAKMNTVASGAALPFTEAGPRGWRSTVGRTR